MESEVYRETPQGPLALQIIRPSGRPSGGAVAFFFGGGWQRGTVSHFLRQAQFCAGRGAMAFLVDYRVQSRQGTTPIEAVQDARAAMRYLKANAQRMGFDSGKLAASGGSAGGHLAFCTTLAVGVDHPDDDLRIQPNPLAIVAFNPVCDTSPSGFGHQYFPQGAALTVSPVHLITSSAMAPSLILHGTNDQIVPIGQARLMRDTIHRQGGKCQLVEYAGRDHGFFNEGPDFLSTLEHLQQFLEAEGVLEGAG